MEDLLRDALDAALRPPVVYADVRVVDPARFEHLAVRNGEASALTSSIRSGIGVRVRTAVAWGFATEFVLSRRAARDAGGAARRMARAAGVGRSAPLRVTDEHGPVRGHYATAMRTDPFSLEREAKLKLLVDAERSLHVDPRVKSGMAQFQAWTERKWFASSEGASYDSAITHVGAGLTATAIAGGEVQRRSAPSSFGGDYRQSGWEYIEDMDLVGAGPRVGKEAVALLTAPPCPTGRTTLVLGTDQLALQIHESVGHATELDRILGMEAGFAGTSFLNPSDREKLTYGSPLMDIVADATEPGGLGTFGWDDEGVPAQRVPLVQHGILTGFLSSRETAARVGFARSGGTVRAESFYRAPLIRMTNIDLTPGELSFDELLEDIPQGVFMETNRSWSIDDKRLNFQFGTEVGRLIEHGELGGLVRNPLYAGMTPEFWRSMDAKGNARTWHLWGVPNCGKGEPGQIARVSHGAPAARFRNVEVRAG